MRVHLSFRLATQLLKGPLNRATVCAATGVFVASLRYRGSAADGRLRLEKASYQQSTPRAHVNEYQMNAVAVYEYCAYIVNLVKKLWWITYRSIFLSLLVAPAAITSPLLLVGGEEIHEKWWRWVRFAVRSSGPCLTKLCQWIATRPDLFPAEVIHELSLLQAKAYRHSWKETEAAMIAAFGSDWQQRIKLSKDDKVIGSGCIASVYAGSVNGEKGKPSYCRILSHVFISLVVLFSLVAIKVIHPGVRDSIESDIQIMKFVAWIVESLPGMENLSILENVNEFSKLMSRQIDFTEEAANLEKFQANFSSDRHRAPVVFPFPLQGLVTREVLVETFIAGDLMSDLFEIRGTLDESTKKRLAEIGIDVVLRMTFWHNFIHGDMHPGNVKVK